MGGWNNSSLGTLNPFVPELDIVFVLAVRSQRELGFGNTR